VQPVVVPEAQTLYQLISVMVFKQSVEQVGDQYERQFHSTYAKTEVSTYTTSNASVMQEAALAYVLTLPQMLIQQGEIVRCAKCTLQQRYKLTITSQCATHV
jgi:hypothetical protein